MYLLPEPKNTKKLKHLQIIKPIMDLAMKNKKLKNFINQILDNFFPNASIPTRKRALYITASVLDVAVLVLILVNGAKPAERMIAPLISPIITSLNSVNPLTLKNKTTEKNFAFAPGWSDGKFGKIDFNNLEYLSFFDLPINADGTIKFDSRSYQYFDTEEVTELFERAHYFNTKVLLTLTLVSNGGITNFLDNQAAWETLAEQAAKEVKTAGVEGVTVDFELKGEISKNYQAKYSQFLEYLTTRFHQELPGSTVAVAIPNSATLNKAHLYNTEQLAKVADKVFIMAYDIASPEVKNNNPITPIFFGADATSYWDKLTGALNNLFTKDTDEKKLVMERAWYGNGDRYPLYVPNSDLPAEEEKEPAHVFLDKDTVNRLASTVPAKGREAARVNIPIIGKALEQEGILDSNVLAYALATIEHETAETFAPIDEIQGRLSSRRLGYEGGTNYFGRGFIQLTHLRNYKAIGERIGMGDQLVKDPSLASTPEVAAKILAAFFKDNNIANLASKGQFVAARRPVNPDRNGYAIAELAWKYGYEIE